MSVALIQEAFQNLWVEDAAFPAIMPSSSEDVMQVILWCREHGMRVLPVGSGHSFGEKHQVPHGVITMISLSRDGISEPDTRDLVIEVESGVPSTVLHDIIHNAGLRLDGWPKDYPGTVGGLLAGQHGPEYRHLVLGMDLIDGRGRSLRFGGRVRKNVSGFDLPGALVGSRGSLAWIDRLYLRLSPGGSTFVQRNQPSPLGPSPVRYDLHERVAGALDPDGVFLRAGE